MKENVTCLIPFYNEGERIFPVLEVITTIREITEIICIDDGSDDFTSKDIKSRFPNVMVIRLPENQGKAAAIRYGLRAATNELIFLFIHFSLYTSLK